MEEIAGSSPASSMCSWDSFTQKAWPGKRPWAELGVDGRRRFAVAPAGDRGRAALTAAFCKVARHRAPRSAAALLAEEKPSKLASCLELYYSSKRNHSLRCSKCSCGLMDKVPPS